MAGDAPLTFFLGPKEFDLLQRADAELTRTIHLGIFGFLATPLLKALKWINEYVGNFGWSIILLTVLINLVLFPLRHKSAVSMRKMQQIQPQVKAIQDRYAKLKMTDPARQKMNQELMELYKAKGANPASGCLPMVLTFPVLFAFYAFLSQAIELRGAPWIGWIHDLSRPRSLLRHAHPHGRVAVLADQDDAADRRSGAAADDDVHAADVHGLLPVGAERPGAVLVDQQPVDDRPAVLHEPAARQRAAGKGALIGTRPPRRERCDRNCTDEVKAFVEQVVEAMGLDVAVEVSDLEDGSVRVDVQGEEGELLLRRKGEGLDALQHLVNSAYRRDVGRDQRIVIDAMNFRQGKDIELQQMAKFLIEKVRTTGVPQELGPLNSYSRRIVHMEVSRFDDVASESQGDGQLKHVTISLRKPAR